MHNTVIIALLFWCLHGIRYVTSEAQRKCGRVYLTVSSLEDTYLELNWITQCAQSDDVRPDYIGLYSTNVKNTTVGVSPLVKIQASEYPKGYYKTNITFGSPKLPGGWEYNATLAAITPGPHCFPFWIASIKGNETIDMRCFGIQPTWMNDNRVQIGPLKISTFFIPGTHDSGAYRYDKALANILKNYILTQDRSIWTQLVHGIRYLDLRVGYYGDEGFYLNHDKFALVEIIPVFEEIKKFVKLAPKEVIVIDFHRFPIPENFTLDLHNKFVSLVEEFLGDLALPLPKDLKDGKEPTLDEIWAQNKSLIICYGNQDVATSYNWLWPPLQQHWADTMDLENLKIFLSEALQKRGSVQNPLFALMAEFTPNVIDIIEGIITPDGQNDLRKLAGLVNSEITKWFRDDWALDANIVATDYFLGNDIINTAIDANTMTKIKQKQQIIRT